VPAPPRAFIHRELQSEKQFGEEKKKQAVQVSQAAAALFRPFSSIILFHRGGNLVYAK